MVPCMCLYFWQWWHTITLTKHSGRELMDALLVCNYNKSQLSNFSQFFIYFYFFTFLSNVSDVGTDWLSSITAHCFFPLRTLHPSPSIESLRETVHSWFFVFVVVNQVDWRDKVGRSAASWGPAFPSCISFYSGWVSVTFRLMTFLNIPRGALRRPHVTQSCIFQSVPWTVTAGSFIHNSIRVQQNRHLLGLDKWASNPTVCSRAEILDVLQYKTKLKWNLKKETKNVPKLFTETKKYWK